MPHKFKNPWCLADILAENNDDANVSLPWQFRVELMERIAKFLSDLHQKNRTYGLGSLIPSRILIQSSDAYGLKALSDYPPAISDDYKSLDTLCLGLLFIQLIKLRDLNLDRSKLPQLFSLLRREGVKSYSKNKKKKKVLTVEEKAKSELMKRELIKERLKRQDFDPEKVSKEVKVEGRKSVGNNKKKDMKVKKKSKEGTVVIDVQSKSGRAKKTQQMMKNFLSSTKNSLYSFSKRMNESRKKKFANFSVSRVSLRSSSSSATKNLFKEQDLIEKQVDKEMEEEEEEEEEEFEKLKEGGDRDKDGYVSAGLIKEELKAYLQPNGDKKPRWLLNLEELVLQMVTSIEENRPKMKAVRNWLLEVMMSFNEGQERHNKVKNIITSKEFRDMSNSLQIEQVQANITETMNRNDYVGKISQFDLMYKATAIEDILFSIQRVKKPTMVFHAKDTTFFGNKEDDDASVDSHLPTDKEKNTLKPMPEPSTSSMQPKNPQNGRSLIEMEQDLPPIFGPQADKLLAIMEEQRNQVGECLLPSQVIELFDQQKKMPHHKVVSLLKRAKQVLDAEPNILEVDAPVIVHGDYHGAYFDLRQVMRFCGEPSLNAAKKKAKESKNTKKKKKKKDKEEDKKNKGKEEVVLNKKDYVTLQKKMDKYKTSQIKAGSVQPPQTKALTMGRKLDKEDGEGKKYVFLGDYVDRGSWGCETLFYLLTMKVYFPETFLLLRGNHESETMAETYGFREECEHKYGREIFHRCVQVFGCFPIGCLVNLPDGKRFFACHGGISDKIHTLDQLRGIERRREPGIEGVLCDLVWSDPCNDNVVKQNNLPIKFEDIEFLPNETRGCAKKFGYKALEKFLKTNELLGIIRAHEAKEQGYQFHFQNAGTKDHLCVTVFSAPNYMNDHGNKGAVLIIHRTVKERLAHQMKRLNYKYTVDQLLRQPEKEKNKEAYLDLLEPICYTEVVQPAVMAFENQNLTIVQQVEETCPYMPTIIDEFYNSSLDILERYGTAQEQLEAYRKEQEEKKLEAQKELDETLKEKQKLKFKLANGKRVWHSVRVNKEAMKKLRERKTLQRQKNSFRFQKTMKRVNETHPEVMKEKLRNATVKLEQMEVDSMKAAAKTDDELKLKTMSSRKLGMDSFSTMKRVRASSENLQKVSKASLQDSFASDAEEDNEVVFGQLQMRAKMKRERIELDYKEEWLALLTAWFSHLASRKLVQEELFDDLADCSLLCRAASVVSKRGELKYYKPKLNSELSAFEVRRNLIVFQDCCKDLGIEEMFLVYDLKNHEFNYVLPCLIKLMKLAKKEGRLTLAYKPEGKGLELFKEKVGAKKLPVLSTAKPEELKERGLEVGSITFNGEERLMLQLLFLMIDVDDTGLITKEGIIRWAREEGKLIRPEHADKVIVAIDYDGDGKIGLRDFFQYAAKLKEEFLTEEQEEEEQQQGENFVDKGGQEDGENEEDNLMFEQPDPEGEGGEEEDGFNASDAIDLAAQKLDIQNITDEDL